MDDTMNLTTANKICKRLSYQYGVVNPPEVIPMKYSRVGKNVRLGAYDYDENRIEINNYALADWSANRITDTIRHELMHARCYQDFNQRGHGKLFRATCRSFGLEDEVMRAKKTKVG
jgi:predicted SprT family Zn-dependent metalloprotease